MEISVQIRWDSGDMSVGIQPGWGECYAQIDLPLGTESKQPYFSIVVSFEPDEDAPVREWKITQVDTSWYFAAQWLALSCEEFEDGEHKYGFYASKVGQLPSAVVNAIEAKWNEVCEEQFTAIEAENDYFSGIDE